MTTSDIYTKLALLSPRLEILLRKVYWKNVTLLSRYKPVRGKIVKSKAEKAVDFNKVLDYLRMNNVGKGSLIIVHSSYDALACTGLSPNQIIDALLGLIGDEGTLAMPVIRHFKEDPSPEIVLKKCMSDIVSIYDVKKTLITTGLLPFVLMKKKGSVTSRFPLNPMTAYGPLAIPMMEKNLQGDIASPHGINSSWKFCLDHNAFIIGLGLNSGFLTLTHVFEEAISDWPIKDWYRQRIFNIIDGDFQTTKTVHERKPKWGLLYFAEENNRHDLIKNNILLQMNNEDIHTCLIDSAKLKVFFEEKNKITKGYPYYAKNTDLL